MKIFLSIFSLFICISILKADELSVNSDIKSVKVFQQGAEIQRNFTAQLKSGVNTVVLTDLSSSVNSSSIQVKLSKSATLLSASFRLNYLGGQKFNNAVRDIKDSIEIVDVALKTTKANILGLTEEESFIKSNKSIVGKDAVLNLADLKAISTYARVRISEIQVALISARKLEFKQQKRYNKLNQQLNEWNAKYKQPSGEIVLDVLNDKIQSVPFELNYVVNNASWKAAYDIRSESIEKPVQLIYKAQVRQNTGIDWKNVDLVISTGNPSVNQNRPIMRPWHIDFSHAYRARKEVEGMYLQNMALDKVMITEDESEESMDYGGVGEYTTLQLNQLNEEFQIALKYDIPSDNKQHMVNMKDFELPAKYQYHSVPKLDKDAFLLAKVTQWENLSLLPGTANLFFENGFIGTSYIDPNMTSDTLLLSLGRDKRIIIEREKIKDFTSKKFIGGSKKETFAFKFTLRNTKSEAVSIEILDQIPISKNKEIEVKLEEYEGAKYTEENGKIEWTLTLPPNSTKELKLVYSVKYPKNQIIPGL